MACDERAVPESGKNVFFSGAVVKCGRDKVRNGELLQGLGKMRSMS